MRRAAGRGGLALSATGLRPARRRSRRDLHEDVIALQRARLLEAALATIGEAGAGGFTVAQVVGRARVSRKTFYDVFADGEDCLLAVFDTALEDARALAEAAYESESAWAASVRGGLAAVLDHFDDAPLVACLFLIETLGGGERLTARRAHVMAELARILDRAREIPSARSPSPIVAEALVGGVLAVLQAHLLERPSEPLGELLAQLMSMIVLPYLGAGAAGRELNTSRPKRARLPAPPPAPSTRDAIAGLNIRLTYRTVAVLGAIAAEPGASNVGIAGSAGINDQGQMSKLLRRLAEKGLIENIGPGQARGGSNAWFLTPAGAQLARATRPRFAKPARASRPR